MSKDEQIQCPNCNGYKTHFLTPPEGEEEYFLTGGRSLFREVVMNMIMVIFTGGLWGFMLIIMGVVWLYERLFDRKQPEPPGTTLCEICGYKWVFDKAF